jgi:hypothetical protein
MIILFALGSTAEISQSLLTSAHIVILAKIKKALCVNRVPVALV